MAAGKKPNGTIRQAERIALHMVIAATQHDLSLPHLTSLQPFQDIWETRLQDCDPAGTRCSLSARMIIPWQGREVRLYVTCVLDQEWTSGTVDIRENGSFYRFTCRINEADRVPHIQKTE